PIQSRVGPSFPTRRSSDLVRYFNQALALQPQASSIHQFLGVAYRGLGDIPQAQAHLLMQGQVVPMVPDPLLDELEKLKKGKTNRSEEHTSELQSRFELVCR